MIFSLFQLQQYNNLLASMSNKSVFIQQLMSERSIKNKRTFIIKKPIILSPIANEEIPPTPKRSKQLRSRSEHPHRKNKTVPIKEGEIRNFKPRDNNAINFKTEQKRTERSSHLKEKQSLPKKYQSSILIRSSTLQSGKSMNNYLKFIRALPQQNYQILTNFGILRKRHRRQSLRINQKAIFEFINNIFQQIYNSLTEKIEQNKNIVENCQKYFSCFEKVKIQVLFCIYYPNNLHNKIKIYLVYQRLILFVLFLLSDEKEEKLTRLQKQSLRLMVQLLRECYNTLFQPIRQQEEIVLSHINQTFQMLKAVGQVQKKCQILQREIIKINMQVQASMMVQEDLKALIQRKDEWPLEQLTQRQMKLNWQYLQIPPVPYLPIRFSEKKYTLVIELDNTLIYYDKETKILKYRPYLDLMLSKILPFYEIVVFSKADPKYVEILVGQIERHNRIFSYILSQQHLTYSLENKIIKDISKLGRQLRNIIIVDHLDSIYKNYKANGIRIQSWYGDKSDKELQKVMHILLSLGESDISNLAQGLFSYDRNNDLETQKK